MVAANDGNFKHYLDRYKYADRHPEQSREHYRAQGEIFLQSLESHLQTTRYLLADSPSIADFALFPFVRQFAGVDPDWFADAPYAALRDWLTEILSTARFADVMRKYPVWQPT